MVFEKKCLLEIFAPKRKGIIGRLEKQHSEDLHNSYPSSSKMRVSQKVTGL
jgi:hypothetical protein